jgi:hypothetical protein
VHVVRAITVLSANNSCEATAGETSVSFSVLPSLWVEQAADLEMTIGSPAGAFFKRVTSPGCLLTMKLVRQTERGLCLAACVAMVANASLEDVCAKCRILTSEDGVRFLPDNEAMKFLAGRMLCYGLRMKPLVRLTDEVTDFTVNVDILQSPAILTVPSQNFPGFNHAVVWDNESRKILDPLHDEPRSVGDYEILEWCPVSHF